MILYFVFFLPRLESESRHNDFLAKAVEVSRALMQQLWSRKMHASELGPQHMFMTVMIDW